MFPSCSAIIRANESTGTSLRTQWISLKIFRCRLNLPLHLRGNNLLYYALLSLSQDFWMVHQWKKYHSQAYRSKTGQYVLFWSTFLLLDKLDSLCGLTQQTLRALAIFPWVYSSLRPALEGMSTPCSAESSLHVCWLLNQNSGNSPAKPLASEPAASCARLQPPQARDHLELSQVSTERCQTVGCPFCKKNLVCWMQPTGIVGNVFVS